MLSNEIAELILKGHISKTKNINEIKGFRLELQLNYSGLMAHGAYRGWKKNKHKGRKKVGCFDFKIFRILDSKEIPITHTRVVDSINDKIQREMIEEIFNGKDPVEIGNAEEEIQILCEIQLAMLEQEINWGDEIFQSWTLFTPSQRKRPRDYVTAYLRRVFDEPNFLCTIGRMKAASGTHGVLPPPKKKKEWGSYIEPVNSDAKPWLCGDILVKYRKVAESMSDNPYYAITYNDG